MMQPTMSGDISRVSFPNSLGIDTGAWDEQDHRQLIRALPTKEDIHMLMGEWLGPLRKEIGEVWEKVEVIDQKMQRCEEMQEADTRIAMLEEEVKTQYQRMVAIQLQAEEAENRSRRNNIRIKGIPETVPASELRETVMTMLNKILENPLDTHIELDRVHRVPTMRYHAQITPRDIVCRVHFFRVKEDIIRAAWQNKNKTLESKQEEIHIFSDLC